MFTYYNANPNLLDTDDCTVRAISCLENISWSEAYKKLCNFARKNGLMMNNISSIEAYLDNFYDRVPIIEETVGEFIDNHKIGRYAITMPNHITALVEGINYDTFDSSKNKIWDAWLIE